MTVCWANIGKVQAQDSIRISLPEAEAIFLQKNLLLLSQQYQIQANKAIETQAALYNNPVFSAEIALKAQQQPWLNVGANGQKAFSVDQLIQLAKKRNKRIALAKEDTRQAELQFYDLLRTLKFSMRHSYYSLAFYQQLISQFDRQKELLQHLIDAYETQAQKRNIAAKDVVRLKTELIQLNSQRSDLQQNVAAATKELQMLLDSNVFIIPKIDIDTLALANWQQPGLLSKALQSRADVRLYESAVQQASLNLNYQKALAVPDLTVGAGYDQNGSYAPHMFSIRTAIELPLFHRNQGLIQQAKIQQQIAGTELQQKERLVQAELTEVLSRLQVIQREFESMQQNFAKDYADINKNMVEQFNKGNVSLIEFLDFFESYNAAISVINQVKRQRVLTAAELEYVVGTVL